MQEYREELCDPLSAVVHPAPSEWLARLAAQDLYHDPVLDCPVAASHAAAVAVLTDPGWRVRPADEPVPSALAGTTAGRIFADMVRMQDGPRHAVLKLAVRDALSAIPEEAVQAACDAVIAESGMNGEWCARDVDVFCRVYAPRVLGRLLGMRQDRLDASVSAFAHGIAPGAGQPAVHAAVAAAEILQAAMTDALAHPGPLLDALRDSVHVRLGAGHAQVVVANAIGLLFQAADSCHGVLAAALIQAGESGHAAAACVDQVLRTLPPIMNTRRFAASGADESGCPVRHASRVLVLLSGQDPAGGNLAFGAGVHACPGEAWARRMAGLALAAMRVHGVNIAALHAEGFRPSANARIPVFAREEAGR